MPKQLPPSPKDPWLRHSQRKAFENGWIKVTEHKCTNPAGNPADYGVVHFKNRAVGVVPYEDGHIWMVGQTRFAIKQYSWEIPEGGCPEDEKLEDCARRELLEETGLTAERLEPLYQMHLSNSVTDEWGIVYLATGLTEGDNEPEDSEDITVHKISLDDLYEAVEAGDITDSLTVTATYKLMLLRAQGKLN